MSLKQLQSSEKYALNPAPDHVYLCNDSVTFALILAVDSGYALTLHFGDIGTELLFFAALFIMPALWLLPG